MNEIQPSATVPRPWWRGPVAAWSFVLTICTALLTQVPGFGVLSFHLSLAVSPLLAMATGSVAATCFLEHRDWGIAFRRASIRAAGLACIPLIGGLISGLREGPCDVAQGLSFYGVWPIASASTALPVGLWCGRIGRRPRIASFLWVTTFVLSFVPAAVDLYREPPIFFHAPFLGRYPGAIHDLALEVTVADLAHRGMCLSASAALLLAGWAIPGPIGRIRPAAMGAAIAAGIALGMGLQGSTWGFRVTRADLERVLFQEEVRDRCRLRHDGSLDPVRAQGILTDCLHHLRKAESFFGLPPGPPLTIYRYRDDEQKARWLGARRVEIAKPWQDAVHLAGTMPLDPIIGHEIAHVVAGRLASNPLRIPLRRGFVPDMARVEGLAEAVAFEDDGPSPHEWAWAMVLTGIPTDLDRLFETWTFLTVAPGRAYTLAGSFLRFLADRHGTEAIRAVARGASFQEATGAPLEVLQQEWRDHLVEAGTAVDRLLLDRVEGRFGGPGVLEPRCVVDVARLQERIRVALEEGDLGRAESCVRRALGHDPESRLFARTLARVLAARGDLDGARDSLGTMHPSVTPGDRLLRADLVALEDGGLERDTGAREVWLDLASDLPPHAAEARALAARNHALELSPRVRRTVLGVLAGLPGADLDLPEALAEAPDDGLVHWIAGRLALGEGRFREALDHLVAAGALGLPGPLVPGDPDPFRTAHLKTLGMAALGSEETILAREALGAALLRVAYEGERLFLEDLLARLERRPESPSSP